MVKTSTDPIDIRNATNIFVSKQLTLIFVVLCFQSVSWGEESADKCTGLSADQEALCQLLASCREIENDTARQKCFEMAVNPSADEDSQVSEDPQSGRTPQSVGIPEPSVVEDVTIGDVQSPPSAEVIDEPKKKRGVFGRIGGAIRNVVRGDRKEETESESDHEEWSEKIVAKTGRIDRNVFLVVLDDGNLYKYSSPPEKRLQIGQKVSVQHIKTWATDSYRITPHSGGTYQAYRIRCERKYLVGTPKKHCEMMLDIDPNHWER